MKKHSKCPNCGRNLTENELYCHFCELEIGFSRESKTKKKNKNKK